MYSLSLTASENLLESVWQSNTAKRMLSFFAIKQCPAESVVPVFTPLHPFSNNLFVFFQALFRLNPYRSFLILTSYYWVLTTVLKVLSLSPNAANATMAWAVEKFGLLERPELLPHSWFNSSSLEKAFMWKRKVSIKVLFWSDFRCLCKIFPIKSAKHIEASFPEGNIKA